MQPIIIFDKVDGSRLASFAIFHWGCGYNLTAIIKSRETMGYLPVQNNCYDTIKAQDSATLITCIVNISFQGRLFAIW